MSKNRTPRVGTTTKLFLATFAFFLIVFTLKRHNG